MADKATDARVLVSFIDIMITTARAWRGLGGHTDEMVETEGVKEALIRLANDEDFDLLMVKMFCAKQSKCPTEEELGPVTDEMVAGVPPMRIPKSGNIINVMVKSGTCASMAEARRMVQNGVVKLSKKTHLGILRPIYQVDAKVTDEDAIHVGKKAAVLLEPEHFEE